MKKLPDLPKWLILVIVIFLCLIFVSVVFPTNLPKEIVDCVRSLGKCDFDSFVIFCADTVLFGQAFTDNCVEIAKSELIEILKRDSLTYETVRLLRRFPKGFEINWDKEKNEITCCRLKKPFTWFDFRKKNEIWKLAVLGIHFPEEEEGE